MKLLLKTLSGKVPSPYFEEVVRVMKDYPRIYPTKSEFIRKAAARELNWVRSTMSIPGLGRQTPPEQPPSSATHKEPVYLVSRGSEASGAPNEERTCARPTEVEISFSDAGRIVSLPRLLRGRRLPSLHERLRPGK